MIHLGRVESFDVERGLGTVRPDGPEGGEPLPFHCTAIAGGSRTIDVGRQVAYAKMPGPAGRWWATHVTPLPPQQPPG